MGVESYHGLVYAVDMRDDLPITKLASCGGCAAKVAPMDLRTLLAGLPTVDEPRVLVGSDTADDAGVYQLSADEAVVTTADFITPLVDDPRLYGAIAAANAIGDVYAMGGTPLCAIALCVFPKELAPDVGREILAGGAAKAAEAGVPIVGGHSVRGPELFYGLAVTGRVHPERIWKNAGARPGDVLVLTKPIGSGLVVNGLRKGVYTLAEARPSLEILATLHKHSVAAIERAGIVVHGATDITGFGLAGHALEMAEGAGLTLRIRLGDVARYADVDRLIAAGVTTGATVPNRDNASARTRWLGERTKADDELLHDPQTSGGLLLSVAAADGARLIDALHTAGVTHARLIGEVVPRGAAALEVQPS